MTEPLLQNLREVVSAAASGGGSTVVLPELDHSLEQQNDPGWLVTVYNNDHNTYDEVITILILATHCSEEEAFIETWEIDHLGKSVVHQADEHECNRVAEVIAKIGIRVEVSKNS